MTKFEDQQPQEKFFAFSRIDEQTKRLSAEALSSIEAAINYLFLTHAGGAVAILSFLSSSDAKRPTGPLIALVIFCGSHISRCHKGISCSLLRWPEHLVARRCWPVLQERNRLERTQSKVCRGSTRTSVALLCWLFQFRMFGDWSRHWILPSRLRLLIRVAGGFSPLAPTASAVA